MTRGLFRRLALPVVLVVCVPICTLGGDGNASDDQEMPKILEGLSLIPGSTEAFGSNSCATFTTLSNTDPCFEPWPSKLPFIAGVDATFFCASAHGIGVGSAVTNLANPTDPDLGVSNNETFNTFSPRIYAGYQDNCWAILGRFWYLSDSSEGFEPFRPPPGAGAGSSAFERLKAYTVDLEVSRAFSLGASKLNLFLGGRYASFEAGEGLENSRLTNGSEIVYTNAFANFSFNGLGVTSGFLGLTPIGCDTQINLFWGFRGTVLWGEAERGVQTMASFVDVRGSTSINSAGEQGRDIAFILEALLGAQWEHQLRCLPMSAFLRIAAEYQYWDLGDDGQAASASFAVSSTSSAVSKGFVGDANAQFIGFSVGAGFRW